MAMEGALMLAETLHAVPDVQSALEAFVNRRAAGRLGAQAEPRGRRAAAYAPAGLRRHCANAASGRFTNGSSRGGPRRSASGRALSLALMLANGSPIRVARFVHLRDNGSRAATGDFESQTS